MANLSVGNGYVLSIVPEMNQKTHKGLVEVALLSGNNFVNTEVWLHRDKDLDYYDDVERFVNAKGLINVIQKAMEYAER
tara:strand:- start:655 stop:891 length:237 start_codon:yes stop_codon:yes gene_type:complete